jgi:hypothetical protein
MKAGRQLLTTQHALPKHKLHQSSKLVDRRGRRGHEMTRLTDLAPSFPTPQSHLSRRPKFLTNKAEDKLTFNVYTNFNSQSHEDRARYYLPLCLSQTPRRDIHSQTNPNRHHEKKPQPFSQHSRKNPSTLSSQETSCPPLFSFLSTRSQSLYVIWKKSRPSLTVMKGYHSSSLIFAYLLFRSPQYFQP